MTEYTDVFWRKEGIFNDKSHFTKVCGNYKGREFFSSPYPHDKQYQISMNKDLYKISGILTQD